MLSPSVTKNEVLLGIPLGIASACLQTLDTVAVQQATEPSMQGRVMALHQMAWYESTPIGALAMGWVIQTTSPRAPLLLGDPRRTHLRSRAPTSSPHHTTIDAHDMPEAPTSTTALRTPEHTDPRHHFSGAPKYPIDTLPTIS